MKVHRKTPSANGVTGASAIHTQPLTYLKLSTQNTTRGNCKNVASSMCYYNNNMTTKINFASHDVTMRFTRHSMKVFVWKVLRFFDFFFLYILSYDIGRWSEK